MSAAYDDSCPKCSTATAGFDGRICCAGCFRYHHSACWEEACAGCGDTRTVGQTSSARKADREWWIQALIWLTVAEVVLWVSRFLVTVEIPMSDVAAIDVLAVLRWLLLAPIFYVLTRVAS